MSETQRQDENRRKIFYSRDAEHRRERQRIEGHMRDLAALWHVREAYLHVGAGAYQERLRAAKLCACETGRRGPRRYYDFAGRELRALRLRPEMERSLGLEPAIERRFEAEFRGALRDLEEPPLEASWRVCNYQRRLLRAILDLYEECPLIVYLLSSANRCHAIPTLRVAIPGSARVANMRGEARHQVSTRDAQRRENRLRYMEERGMDRERYSLLRERREDEQQRREEGRLRRQEESLMLRRNRRCGRP